MENQKSDVNEAVAQSMVNSSPIASPASADTNTSSANSSTPSVGTASQEIAANDDQSKPIWGVIHALKPEFYDLDLDEDKSVYMFGRASSCEYNLDIPAIQNTEYGSRYSKKHFCIKKIVQSIDGTSTNKAFIKDLNSTNGVFIDGKQIPKDCDYPLKSLQKIAISSAVNEVILFSLKNHISPHPKELEEKYIIDKKIGKGAFGVVFAAWQIASVTKKCAVKVVYKTTVMSRNMGIKTKAPKDEADILKQIDHPCIIGVIDVIDTDKQLYMVLEYAEGGDLFTRLYNDGALLEPIAKLFCYQMLLAVDYLHKKGITHRDLKPENILMMSKKSYCLIKITDFGTSRLVSEARLMSTLAGTLSYLAPELIQIQTQAASGYTKLVDLWSLGVILYVCLVAYPPFNKERPDTEQTIENQILSGNLVFPPNHWEKVSAGSKDLIRCLVKVNVGERLSAEKAIAHSWMKDQVMLDKARQLMGSSENSDRSSVVSVSKSNTKALGLLGERSCNKRELSDSGSEIRLSPKPVPQKVRKIS